MSGEAEAITEAIHASLYAPWLVLPGPVDVAPQLANSIAEWLSNNRWELTKMPDDHRPISTQVYA